MRDLAIVLAEEDTNAVLSTLLTKRGPSLGIRPLDFDPAQDITRDAAGKDSGCYLRGASLLGPRRKTHRHGLVILDEQWAGSPGWQAIEAKLSQELAQEWGDQAEVVAIAPETEVWAFIQSEHLPKSLRWPEENGRLQTWLEERGAWPSGHAKPPDPKNALALLSREGGVRITPRWFEGLAGSVGLTKCTDRAFLKFVATLRRWFPMDAG